jgi:hypothetical protein
MLNPLHLLSLLTETPGTDEEYSWLLATELRHAQEVINDFHKAHLNKPRPLASL